MHTCSVPASFTVDLLRTLGERIDETAGDAIEHGPHHHFERAVGKSVFQGEQHLAGIVGQGLELPMPHQHRERDVDQHELDALGVIVRVTGGATLLHYGQTDHYRSLHHVASPAFHLRTPSHG